MSRYVKIFVLITIALTFSISALFADVVNVVSSLDLGNPPWAQFDLSNTHLLVTGDSFSKIYGYVDSGYHNGAWDGYGIVSSYAATHPPYTLGVLSGVDYNNWNGLDFFGYTIQNPWIVVRYTKFGDSNLDGDVNSIDHYLVTNAYNLLHDSNPNNNPPINWLNGDYNYDGAINQLDYPLVPEPSAIILLVTGGMMMLGLCLKRHFRAV